MPFWFYALPGKNKAGIPAGFLTLPLNPGG
jgi:hypothetical protein